MPIYEYKCRECGREYEELVSSADQLPPCPQCGSVKVDKLMSACAIQGEGGGDAMSGFGGMPPMGGGCGGGGG